MLETSQERVILLKAGFSCKDIERLYIEYNNFKLINFPILYEANEFNEVNSLEVKCIDEKEKVALSSK